jgi:hypothetical protein
LTIEALDLAPNFLEDFDSDSLLDAVPGGMIRMKLLCQVTLECRIPEIPNILSVVIIAGTCRSLDQVHLRYQGATVRTNPLLSSATA